MGGRNEELKEHWFTFQTVWYSKNKDTGEKKNYVNILRWFKNIFK